MTCVLTARALVAQSNSTEKLIAYSTLALNDLVVVDSEKFVAVPWVRLLHSITTKDFSALCLGFLNSDFTLFKNIICKGNSLKLTLFTYQRQA